MPLPVPLRTRRIAAASVAALAVVAATSLAVLPATSATALGGSVISGADRVSLGSSVGASAFPTGATTAIVVPNTSDRLLTEAASVASLRDQPLVFATDAASTGDRVKALKATKAVLWGTASDFPSTYQSALSQKVTVDASLIAATPLARASNVIAATKPGRLVVTGLSTIELRLGGEFAVTAGYEVITLNGTETDSELTTFFTNNKSIPTTLVGSAQIVGTKLSTDAAPSFANVETDDPLAVEQSFLDQQVALGAQGNRLYAAPNDQLDGLLLAANYAHHSRGVALAAGPYNSIGSASAMTTTLGLWGSEASSLSLIGQNVTAAQKSTLDSKASAARASAPAWRATNVSLGSGSWSVTYTPFAGAAQYIAYDLYGNEVGRSATTSVTVNSLQSIVLVAVNSSQAELKRLEITYNRYDTSDDRASAVVASTVDGSSAAHLSFLGSLKAPRVITRSMTDPMDPDVPPVVTTLAVTCLTAWTDATTDPTKQYTYDARTLSGQNNRACDSTAATTSSSAAVLSSLVFIPPTVYPDFGGARSNSASAAPRQRAAAPTTTDAALMSALHHESNASRVLVAKNPGLQANSTSRAAASSLPDLTIIYRAFIRQSKVYFPFMTAEKSDPSHPLIYFGGDGHEPGNLNGTHRLRADIFFRFQSSPQSITMTPSTGVTHEYTCARPGGVDCVLVATAQQNTNGINVINRSISGDRAKAELTISSPIPLVPAAPPISADFKFDIRPGASTVTGSHDAMPTHEYYYGVANSFATLGYASNQGNLYCLWGFLPGCHVAFNRGL